MQSQSKTCPSCNSSFEIAPADFAFYKKFGVTPPTLCPDCRQQRLLAFRNERWMFKRRCDFSGKNIISMYPPDCPFKIYDQEIWWSDKWDAHTYGRDYDFNRPFFEQFRELQLAVPRVALVNKRSENCDYTNHSGDNKNCFMSAITFESEDIYYSDWIVKAKNCIDCTYLIENNELAYETWYSWNGYRVFFCDLIRQCSDLWFGFDCINVKNSFMCWNLRNKNYCIRNKQYSKEDYEKEMRKIFPLTFSRMQALRAEYAKVKKEIAIHPATYEINTENSLGDLLFESKNCEYAFDCIHVEDSRHIYDAIDIKDSMDVYHVGWAELMYECHAISRAYNCRFCHFTYDNTNCTYCDCTQNSRNLFGCAGMNKAEFCILNKQYTQEQYEKLVPKIIEHMKKTGEWGEFFPLNFSPFAYNQSRAQEFYPLTKAQVEAKGWRWSEFRPAPPEAKQTIKASDLPETMDEINDDILNKAILCEVTNQPFRIIKQELDFYRKLGLLLPHRHPDQRYIDRFLSRPPRKLFPRKCQKCGAEISTSYREGATEKVYCRDCYLAEVY